MKKLSKKLAYVGLNIYLCGVVNINRSTWMSKNRVFILINANNIGEAMAYTTRSEVARIVGCNRKTITGKSPVFYKSWIIVETTLNTARMGLAIR